MSLHERSSKLNCFVNETFAREIVIWIMKILQIEPVIFKFSLIVVSCFSDIADEKRKTANNFWNKNYENKISKIYRDVANDIVKREKRWQSFYSSCISQIVSDFCGFSKRPFFNMKKSLLQLKIEEENLYALTTLNKDPCFVWFWVSFADHHHSSQH